MSGAAIRVRGETNFASPATPEHPAGSLWTAGKDVVIRFRNSDLKRVEEALGPSFFNDFFDSCRSGVIKMEVVEVFMEHGIKKKGEPYKVPDEVLDEIPYHDMCELLFEGICRSFKGKTATAYFEEMAEAYAKALEAGQTPLARSPDTIS